MKRHGQAAIRIVIGLAVLVSLVAVPPAPGQAAPDDPPKKEEPAKKKPKKRKKWVEADKVYFGRTKGWDAPAEVDVDAVYAEIEEYKKILEQKLEPDDAKYVLLMAKASKRFRKAVRKAAKAGSYDLVAGTGAVHGVDDVPDITSDVIGEL